MTKSPCVSVNFVKLLLKLTFFFKTYTPYYITYYSWPNKNHLPLLFPFNLGKYSFHLYVLSHTTMKSLKYPYHSEIHLWTHLFSHRSQQNYWETLVLLKFGSEIHLCTHKRWIGKCIFVITSSSLVCELSEDASPKYDLVLQNCNKQKLC